MFEGFKSFAHVIGDVTIHGRVGGSGPPLLLLHGYPQTHVMWHKMAPDLAKRFTVIAPDLRGYGASTCPRTRDDHSQMSKREMAADMVALMRGFGFKTFDIMAHDRGARVAHRLGMDSPYAVRKMIILDIAPTREMYANTTLGFARTYAHWFYLTEPYPLPERMIEADPRDFWNKKCTFGAAGDGPFSDEARDAYHNAFSNKAVIHASCEDYRAAATIDIAHDDADGARKLTCPIHVLWGAQGAIEAYFDCLELWKLRAETVTGKSLPGAHYLAEELPERVLREAFVFLGVGAVSREGGA
ncbi:alpha/beta hydrolase [uncultured Litoreibacter sp.]|uniref:alpha/beta fold hydrolase n=1 Tax=uncultured Litoreibacter sp. TaxID=1392394 RepID=UPI00263A2D6A|nr:alpha/beta hydrolase [uncultured Litoreibacter sp.]